MTSDDYNNVRSSPSRWRSLLTFYQGTTIQLLCFLAAEFPVQLMIKRFGFKTILPGMMMLWGTVCTFPPFQTLSARLNSL